MLNHLPVPIRAVSQATYSFSAGPFRNMYAKYGYNPRASPANAAFQLMDFRLTPETAKSLSLHNKALDQ